MFETTQEQHARGAKEGAKEREKEKQILFPSPPHLSLSAWTKLRFQKTKHK